MSLRLTFMGTPDFAVPALEAILETRHSIATVYTQPPRQAGRGMAMRQTPVHRLALASGLEVRTPESLRTIAERDTFVALNADVVVVVAYGLILPKSMINLPPLGCINIHASLLPRWRGAAPIARAIMEGDGETGISIMRMDEGLDTGDVGPVKKLSIPEGTTAGDVHDSLARLGAEAIVETLNLLGEGKILWKPQQAALATYARKIDKMETHIVFDQSAERVLHFIHGLSPEPGAWATLRLEDDRHRLKFLRAERAPGSGIPGEILDNDFAVACAGGAIRPLLVQREGKMPLARAEFLRGLKIGNNARLE